MNGLPSEHWEVLCNYNTDLWLVIIADEEGLQLASISATYAFQYFDKT